MFYYNMYQMIYICVCMCVNVLLLNVKNYIYMHACVFECYSTLGIELCVCVCVCVQVNVILILVLNYIHV